MLSSFSWCRILSSPIQPDCSFGGQAAHPAGRAAAFMNNNGLPLDLSDGRAVEFEGGTPGAGGGGGNAFQRKLSQQVHCEHGTADRSLVAGTLIARGVDDIIEGVPVASQPELPYQMRRYNWLQSEIIYGIVFEVKFTLVVAFGSTRVSMTHGILDLL